VTQRPVQGSGSGLSGTAGDGYGDVTVDDIALFSGRLSTGALVSFEASRFATGRKNDLSIEVSGDKGALRFRHLLRRDRRITRLSVHSSRIPSNFT